jgi:REP element-mobilizing transposase RayT
MTLPRDIPKGRVYLLTRRSAQRQFLLRPDETTNRIFLYCLIVAAQRFNIGIIAVSTMSNHYHAVVFDPDGVLPRFLELFHALTARAINRHRGLRENLWAAEQPNFNYCVEQCDVLEKTVYTLVNPVNANLVDKVANWPGVSSMNWLDGRTILVDRPRGFFSNAGMMPKSASLKLIVPPGYDSDRASWAQHVLERIVESEKSAAARRAISGARVVGRKKVLAASPYEVPNATEPARTLRPLIAAKNPTARARAIEALKEFRRRYHKARAAFCAGDRGVLFPLGTFGLLRYCAVSVAPW